MKKIISVFLISIFVFAGCESSSNGEIDTESLAGTEIELAIDPVYQEWLDPHIEEFNNETGIVATVNYVGMGDTIGTLAQTLPAGEAPDLFIAPYNKLGTLVTPGFIVPVESTDFETAYGPITAGLAKYQEQAYFYPLSIEAIVLYYNKELTNEENLQSINLEDLSTIKAYDDEYGIIWTATDLFLTQGLIGAPWFDDKDNPTDLKINEEPWVSDIAQIGAIMADWPTTMEDTTNSAAFARNMFSTGEVSAIIEGPWMYDTFSEALGENLGITAIEGFKPFSGLTGLAITNTGDEQKQEAAQLLAQYLTTEAQADFYEKTNRLPALTSAQESISKEDEYAQAVIESYSGSESMVISPIGDEVWVPMANAIIEVSNGKDAQQALDDAAEIINQNVQTKYGVSLT